MTKHFKTKRVKKHFILRLLIYIFLIYLFFSLIYNILYNSYLSKLSNEKIINHIIANTKNESNNFLRKFTNPHQIIKNNFVLNEPVLNTIPVSNEKKQIYLYCTHETEEYSDSYLELYNITPNIKTISYILKDYLNDLGLSVDLETRSVTEILRKHDWSYKYSYEASRELIIENISTNNYSLIIDLHRDSSLLKNTLLTYNNTNYARVLFVIGGEQPNYEQNYQVAEELSNNLNELIPDISRGLLLKKGSNVNGIYNQDLSNKMVLIEIGGEYNEIEDLNNTLEILSRAILKYIERITT